MLGADVAEALWYAATKSLPPVGLLDARGFNVGTGIGTSVIDLAKTLIEEGIRLAIKDGLLSIRDNPKGPNNNGHS